MASPVSVSADHVVLRNGTPAEVAQHLRQLRSTAADPALITANLHDAVTQGSIPQAVFSIWTPLSRDAQSIVASLRQSDSLAERKAAIKTFIKALRSPGSMTEVWDAAGGASGLARLISNLSVNEVKLLCNGLAKTASLPGGQSQRHAMLTELVNLLCNDTSAQQKNPDARPLLSYYQRILPACTTERVIEHEKSQPAWSQRQRTILLRTHASFYGTKFLESVSSPPESKGNKVDDEIFTQLINNNFGFAQQMLLKCIEVEGPLATEPHVFMDKLAQPIAKRLRRRSAPEQNLPYDVLELLVRLIKKHPVLAERLDASLEGIIFHVIKFWESTRSTRPRVQQCLGELIGLAPESEFRSMGSIVPLLRAVNPVVSYELFRLIIKNSKHHNFDINDTSDGNGYFGTLKGRWPADIFTALFGQDDPEASLRLFKRLMAVFPDGSFLQVCFEHGNSIAEHGRSPSSDKGDPEVVEALLLRASSARTGSRPESAIQIEKSLEDRKSNAARSSGWEGRSAWARSALRLCIAAGSLELYAETLLWARRFNKDPETVKQLYSTDTLEEIEGIDLLSGISLMSHPPGSPNSNIKTSVESANKILLQLLETASMALREPSFQQYDWYDVINLPGKVVEHRLQAVEKLQKTRGLSDAEVFDLVWQPTLEALVEAERYLLKPGLQRLRSREITGFLRDIDCPQHLRPHSAKFLDHLAQARDELWENYRPQHFPAVITLGDAWPKGLPVQHLCPTELNNLRDLPFVYSRVEAVVFCNPELLLEDPPSDKETRKAIGPFVDNYYYALKAYVNSASNATDRETRIRKVWRHGIDKLNGTRMTSSESMRFWSDIFDDNEIKLPRDLKAELPKHPEPVLPQVDDPETPTEWNPDEGYDAIDNAGSQDLSAAILDQMLTGPSWGGYDMDQEATWETSIQIKSMFDDRTSFWDVKRFGWPIPSWRTKDGLVASLFLHLNTLKGADTSILRQPFPSRSDVRYPALYLDQEFLESVDQDYFRWETAHEIDSIVKSGPAVLLERVARSVLQKVEETEKPDAEEQPPIDLAVRLIRLLTRCDRPALAFTLVKDVILGRPDDSAWHRELLNKGLFNTLPPSEARKLLSSISDGIQEKLAEQISKKKEATDQSAGGSAGQRPTIKVTTVKMLAKLLSDAPSIDTKYSLDVLAGLLDKAKHVDIRVAIIQSLFDTLASENTPSETKNDIVGLLEKHAVPLAASVNERQPPTEAEWASAEEDGDLPTVLGTFGESEVRQMFGNWDFTFHNDLDTRAKLAHLTSQAVKQSAENNRRWTEAFLKKHGFALPSGESLPIATVDAGMLQVFARNLDYLSRSTFEMIRGIVLANICPPPGIAAIAKEIRHNRVLYDSNAGEHWISVYGRSNSAINRYGVNRILEQMHQPVSQKIPDPSDRVTLEMLQQFAQEVSGALIKSGGTAQLEAVFKGTASSVVAQKDLEALQRWKKITLPVLQDVIRRVEKLRTPAWQQNPSREPKLLPDTFRLKVALLAIPPDVGLEQTFVEEISSLINELAESKAPYHDRWAYLKQEALRIHGDWKRHYVHLALLFGSLNRIDLNGPLLADHLRVEMAEQLILRASEPGDKAAVTDLKNMLRQWAECPVEEFRIHSREVVKRMKDSHNADWLIRDGDIPWMKPRVDEFESETDSDSD